MDLERPWWPTTGGRVWRAWSDGAIEPSGEGVRSPESTARRRRVTRGSALKGSPSPTVACGAGSMQSPEPEAAQRCSDSCTSYPPTPRSRKSGSRREGHRTPRFPLPGKVAQRHVTTSDLAVVTVSTGPYWHVELDIRAASAPDPRRALAPTIRGSGCPDNPLARPATPLTRGARRPCPGRSRRWWRPGRSERARRAAGA